MKFGHLIECNMINTFLKKLYTHCAWEKLVPDPTSLDQHWEML